MTASQARVKRRFALKRAREYARRGWAPEWKDLTDDLDKWGIPSVEGQAKVWFNNIYIVWVLRFTCQEFGRGVHLMVSHADGKKEIPWDHLQRIKNELAGTAIVALEVYPTEADRIDHNCRHLWCLWPGVELTWGLHVDGATGRPKETAQEAKDPLTLPTVADKGKLWQPKPAATQLLDPTGRPIGGGILPEDFLSPGTA